MELFFFKFCSLFSGKRKGRGGRRGLQTPSDVPSDSPKRKDLRIEFQGHLSHASPPITRFFHPQSNEQIASNIEKLADVLDNSEQVASTLINSEAPASEDVAPANTVQTITENLEDTSDKGADEGNVFNNHLGYNPTYLSVS